MSIDRMKDAGGIAGGFVLLLIFLALPVVLLLGLSEFSVWALDWIPGIIGIAIFGSLILLPLALIAATRGVASAAYGLAALIFGACLWLYSLAFTYIEWGAVGVVVGVLMAGIGVIFTGAIAAIISGTWVVLGNIAFLFALYLGCRILSSWLARSVEDRGYRLAMRESPSEVVVAHRLEPNRADPE